MALDIISPVQNLSYINKDFEAIYPELLDLVKQLTYKWDPSISNESDPGVILLKLNAIIGDKLNYNIDKNILECFPLSVTQIGNARQLFALNGYYAKWYRGATTDISIKYTASSPLAYYTIPAFTRVSDYDNNIVYTLVGPSVSSSFVVNSQQLSTDGTVLVFRAIQGIPVQYDINGETLIRYNMLDSNRRLYFSTTDIAENGIFITNRGLQNYNLWEKVDNLTVQTVSNSSRYYKFGVTSDGSNCYVEFPENAESIFGEGIEITYIKTVGTNGNIPARIIEKFYSDLVPIEDTSIILNSDNCVVTNYSAAVNGSDPESINDAYRNYKRTVGTFDTLVTLRDYFNYIVTSGLVSNCIVSDRTNDIQSSYKIISKSNDADSFITVTTETEGKPDLTAYSLKLYLLKYVPVINNANDYDTTFEMLANAYTSAVKDYIQNNKSIQHDYVDISAVSGKNIAYFKAMYPVTCTISTQYSLTASEANDMINNIKLALYQNLNAKVIDFGDEIPLDYLKNIIVNADRRIKDVIMASIDYKIYAMLYDESDTLEGFGNFRAVDLSDISNQEAKNIAEQIYAKSVLAGLTQFFIKDEPFDYHINQIYTQEHYDIASLFSNVNINFSSSSNTYELKQNENLQFFAPNLIESSSYSNYVKVEWQFLNSRTVTANQNFELAEGEYIAFYWKDTSDADEVYQYKAYSKGNIICPTFDMATSSSNRPGQSYFTSLLSNNLFENLGSESNPVLVASSLYNGDLSSTISTEVQGITNSESVLSGNKKIQIKVVNSIVLDSTNTTYYCYWYLNQAEDDRFILFSGTEEDENGYQSRTLDTGEYFFYTNSDMTQLNILGAGTKITRPTSSELWGVIPLNLTDILVMGLSAFQLSDWYRLVGGARIQVTEQQYITLSEGAIVKIEGIGDETISFDRTGYSITDQSKTLDDYTISYYFTTGGSIYYLPNLNIDSIDSGWDGRSLLNLNLSENTTQALLGGQSITYYAGTAENIPITIEGSNNVPAAGYRGHEVVLLASRDIYFSGAGKLITKDESLADTYLTLYEFKEIDGSNFEQGTTTSKINWNSANSSLAINFDEDITTMSIPVAFPVGEYIIPVSIPKDLDDVTTISYGSTTLHKMIDASDTDIREKGIHYMYMEVASTNQSTITITVPAHDDDFNISILNIYRYTLPSSTDLNGLDPEAIENYITTMNIDELYNYTYEVDPDTEIENPLEPLTFLDPYHVCNPYTICQLYTDNSKNTFKVLNMRKN